MTCPTSIGPQIKRWTAEDDAALRAMLAGHSLAETATALGRTVTAIRHRSAALGIGRNEARRATNWAEFTRLVGEGCSMREIARRLGISRETVAHWIKSPGDRPRSKGPRKVFRPITVKLRPKPRPYPAYPTMALPGSKAKLKIMADRVRRGERPHHPADARFVHESGQRSEGIKVCRTRSVYGFVPFYWYSSV